MDPKILARLKLMDESRSHQSEFCKEMKSIEIESEAPDHRIGQYDNKLQFWLTCLGSAVGYGNIWRFPYMLYENGGGVFFIPFIICIIVICYPLYYLEIAYGQMYNKTMHKYFSFKNASSGWQGISIGIFIVLFFQSIMYMCLLGWCFNFFLFSFQSPLPWAVTDEQREQGKFFNESYFKHEFLQVSQNVFDINTYNFWIMFSLIGAALLTFGTIFRGMDTAKMAVYIMIPLPYVILAISFFKGLFLPGKEIGWKFLFVADWSKLFTLQIWRDAAGQVLFSSGIGINLTMHFASLNNKSDKLLLPGIGLPTLNFLTSLFASATLFAFIGHASYKSGVPIQDMPIEGLELAFVAYPAIMASFPYAQVWSALFFIMLVSIGLGSEFAYLDSACTILYGFLQRTEWFRLSKVWVTT